MNPRELLPSGSVEWATDGLIAEPQLYQFTAALMAASALVFLLWTVRLPSNRRRYGLIATYFSVVLCITYAGMSIGVLRFESLEGQAIPVTRFVGYAFSISAILFVIGRVGGVSRTTLVSMLVAFLGILGGTLGSWFLAEPMSLVSSLAALLSFPLIAYATLGPGARAAARASDERALLYGKLRNLLLLAWVSYLIIGGISRQGLGLLDAFGGVFLGTYVDVILHIGIAAILLRHGTALDQLSGGSSPSVESEGDLDAVDSVESGPA